MNFLNYSPPVQTALNDRQGVVALETSLVSHGLPWPRNLETARAMEAAVISAGAQPATIGIYRGSIRIGLDDKLLQIFAQTSDAAKVGLRDLAASLDTAPSGTECGGTTVSATLFCAAAAGICLFATGGIGGVHHGAEESFDISNDLVALGRHGVAVVCSGAKSILDLPKTLEVLETQGVPVIGYRTDRLPAFYARDCGLKLERSVDGAESAARLIDRHLTLGLESSLLFVNPIPEEFAIPWPELEEWTARAKGEAARDGIAGKAVTPYLLKRIGALSEGRTLAANQALATANAAVAGEIAVALARLSGQNER
jgi:pseudouridine-5'-phosphate glycosidase